MSASSGRREDDLEPGDLVAISSENDVGVELSTMCDCEAVLTRWLPPGTLMLFVGTMKCTCDHVTYERRKWVVDVFLTSDGIIAPHRVIDRPNALSSGQFKRSWMKRVPK